MILYKRNCNHSIDEQHFAYKYNSILVQLGYNKVFISESIINMKNYRNYPNIYYDNISLRFGKINYSYHYKIGIYCKFNNINFSDDL